MASRASSDVVVRFIGDTGNLDKGLSGLSGRFSAVTSSLQGIAAAGAVVGAVSFFKGAIQEADEAARIGRKTEAVIKSTGQAAGITSNQVGKLAEKLSNLAGVDDEVIQQGENVLLTFTKIRNEAGKGNDIFDQASLAALDMAAAMDKTGDSGAAYQENVIRLGKALNDPIAGLTALKKVGVSFTDAQKDQIHTMVEAGDVAGAQKIILAELQTEFGGAAEANATASGKAAVAWGNFAEAVGGKVLPAVEAVGNWLTNTGIPKLGQFADAVEDVAGPVFGGLVDAGEEAVGFWNSIPGPVQNAAIAMGAWALVGDRVTELFSRGSGSMKGFTGDVKTAMGAFDVGRVQGSLMVLEERLPVVGEMGKAFRENASAALALSNTLPGVSGAMTQVGAVARGTLAAGLTGARMAAGSLVGFLGGPWGAALAGATVLVSAWADRQQKASQREAQHESTLRSLTGAYVESKGAITDAMKQQQVLEGQSKGLYDWGKKIGVSADTMTEALYGNEHAIKAVDGALKTYVKETPPEDLDQSEELMNNYNSFVDLAGGMVKAQDASREVRNNLASAGDAAEAAGQKAKESEGHWAGFRGIVEINGQSFATAAQRTDLWKTSLAEVGVEMEGTEPTVEDLANAVDNYHDSVTGVIEGEEAWEASLDGVTDSIKENGTSLDIHTAAGRANRDAVEEAASASLSYMNQQIASGVPMAQALAAHNARIAALKDEAVKTFGVNSEAVALIDTYSKAPPQVVTAISVTGFEDTYGKLQQLSGMQYFLAHPKPDGSAPTPVDIRAYNKQVKGASYAGGGLVGGAGGPRQDNQLAWVSPREVIQSNAAGDYYGRDFLLALNERRIPRDALRGYAGGGLVAPFPVSTAGTKIPAPMQLASIPGGGSAVAGYKASSGVAQWTGLVLKALAELGQPASLLPNVLRRMNQESGGNPRAINNWDSNAKKGTPSIGLMQTIGPTFNRWAGPYVGRGIYDPMANIFAGLNYAVHRYPSLKYAMDKPGGYKNGGWLKPGQVGVNETSKPEAVMSSSQWDALERLVAVLEKNTGQPSKVINVGGVHVTNDAADVMQQIRFAELMAGA